ncbi:cobyric acid synthase [Clostridium hydrogeniformans]|uniref:cobyric acid synthase n=1 Tax=Clostridium hydrogeniformans TaxID=349933 RepID=UPI000482FB25|nr:cobyric acid synthase [Clostridium hydrogeniformans]
MAKIMVQGTGSTVGKSVLVAALCRIFKQDGLKVCPYKSQNMALNSYITLDGKEMGRAQVLQAYAAGLEPEVYMNPILLKPSSDRQCQVVVNGKVYCNSSAKEYHNLKPQFSKMLKEEFEKIEKDFDVIVMEGAGSPAEINLRDRDIVNMGMAELVDAPVVLVGDIDKGGVFASLVGTMVLLSDEEKKRIKGTIINKFRGDIDILTPGIDMLEDITKISNLGVVPYFRLQLEDEDGSMMEINKEVTDKIDVAVIMLPHISNFTDVDPLKNEEDVSVRFVTSLNEFKNPDLLVIPGSKNTIGDLNYLKESGLYEKIKAYSKNGNILGICGGYQILGKTLKDPYGVESKVEEAEGLGLLDVHTVFNEEKITTRINGELKEKGAEILGIDNIKEDLYGYEIHMGETTYGQDGTPLFHIISRNGETVSCDDGAINKKGNIMGTYIHGIFDGVSFRESLVNKLRQEKGLDLKKSGKYEALREAELDKLAHIVRSSLDMNKIYEIIGLEPKK